MLHYAADPPGHPVSIDVRGGVSIDVRGGVSIDVGWVWAVDGRVLSVNSGR
ncbi:hypothetical protein F2Q70_00022031 [Brassica cretica]|uniref:Uncharacterized protein n=2 Tax=Brassica cretica TaxID=69181 RepID=A0A8S9HD05_BRACR|nr:hypothetical protein F2Q70_00022031 [Brassica cretica]KAF2555799.1 hypothetical protein F2Q68_00015821 [Brassica cretica]KAF3607420.1 hypothetical protein DY000_02048378 [Brassica cretica]